MGTQGYYTALHLVAPVATPRYADPSKISNIKWQGQSSHSGPLSGCVLFTDVHNRTDIDSFMQFAEPRNTLEKHVGPNHWLIWADYAYVVKQRIPDGATRPVLVATTEHGAQYIAMPWVGDAAYREHFYGAWRFDGLSYHFVDVLDLYQSCTLWERMTDTCHFCGALENKSCLRTLMQLYGENPTFVPRELPLEVEGNSRRQPDDHIDIIDVFDEMPPQILGWEKLSQTVATGQFFRDPNDFKVHYFPGSQAGVDLFRSDLSGRARAAAKTRKMRKHHCHKCPFEIVCQGDSPGWGNSLRGRRWDKFGCVGGWDDIDTVAERLETAVNAEVSSSWYAPRKEDTKPLKHWLWLGQQIEQVIQITAGWLRKRPRKPRRRTTRSFRLGWDFHKQKYALFPLHSQFSPIHFHSYKMLMRTAAARGWEIKGLMDPASIDMDTLHPRTRRILQSLFRLAHRPNTVRIRRRGCSYVGDNAWRGGILLYNFKVSQKGWQEGVVDLDDIDLEIWTNTLRGPSDQGNTWEVLRTAGEFVAFNLDEILRKQGT